MLYIIIITIILFFVLIFLFINHINIDNNKKNDLNNINNPKEVLSVISVKNYDNKLINIINTSRISGIIINIDDLDIDDLANIIKNIKRSINRKIFIALDQDYKSTYNIAYHQKFKVYPSYIGERKSEEYAYKIAYDRALKLKSLGINMILSPICNTYCNEKSHLKENIFTNDKILASRLIYQTVKAQKDAGLITALKYFPKYYDDELYIDKEIDNVENILDNRETFLAGIKANADIIVISHIKDTDKYKDFLINNMKFKGIIMTDYINDNKNIISYGINVFAYNYYRNKNIKNMIENNLKDTDLEVCSKVLNLIKKL
ncbi:beta-N-acetylglucosaminidase [Brachyspira hyodysenteriae]|uniref:glycoside hydrolase family 3 N-terminal domain-containing protein n=1 Tax=Brachyspira hyodysenteriae TaxID=159 RepID=UPI00063DBED5|nr:glycoside hydrolase family 3 N-terminal domain-containing protein [Brachyspira hyodysenteriae]KLI25661.1 beta-N-acetylglucosaminidase [Brachyspira hyodysenteriae]KLI30494.1 beta-N-acetylglucosaminidase [Brachyspira hyodysenteriae]MDA0035945.1 beta-N-acetylglucosaminidase [Brachyspira hyodysenteriae]MDA0050035.1 beta-N-acetylglucosaminidase [Brachyspira hyodysenteriae]MDA0063187.1 beta-N-acetylglucosaminidase [Brachyspira hyodysenteriae]